MLCVPVWYVRLELICRDWGLCAPSRSAQRLVAEGSLSAERLHEDLGFEHRLAALYEESPAIRQIVTRAVQFPRPSPACPNNGEAFFSIMTHPHLLSVVAQLLGSEEVVVNGNHRLRPKLPSKDDIFVIPFHQDACFFHPSADPQPSHSDWSQQPPMITAWIPFVDVDEMGGCLQMLRSRSADGSSCSLLHELHRHYVAEISDPARPEVESSAQSTSIHPDFLPPEDDVIVTPCPVSKGDVVLFTSLAIHRSLPNHSDCVRWSADIRYQVPQAGNCFPREASFMAARGPRAENHEFEYISAAGSSEGNDEAETPAWQRWVDMRASHTTEKIRPGSSIEIGTERPWRPARGEAYRMPMLQHPLEGPLEFRGRLMAVQKQQQNDASRAQRRRREQVARI
jgi:hypothetical protein